jgi:hypothetical protein
MAVTKQVYTATATWTASQLADIFRSAFIDAGLMTEWYASFLSGSVQNRVLEVVYDAAKTYGKTYYWFQFTTTGAFVSQSTRWNTASHIPAGPSGVGTQYLDWVATTTNSTTNHHQLLALVTGTTVTLTRYAASGRSFFVLRSAANYYTFTIDPPAISLQTWVDLDKGYFNGLIRCVTLVLNSAGMVDFLLPYRTRRCFVSGLMCRGATTTARYNVDTVSLSRYSGCGASNNSAANSVGTGMSLPAGYNVANPEFATDFNPVYTGIRVAAHNAADLPADFGIFFPRNNNTFSISDTVTVTPGVEEYEVLAFTNNTGVDGQASSLLLARTI